MGSSLKQRPTRSVRNNMRVIAKCISQVVSFVFFTQTPWNGETRKFLLLLLKKKGLRYTFLRSEIENMCVAARRISHADSFVFFKLIARNDRFLWVVL